MNKFKFNSVGQGLFYTGQINDDFCFVYDCGAESKKRPHLKITNKDEPKLFEAIQDFSIERGEKKNIDFLVLSHLHGDHINGVSELLRLFSVKKVFLPYYEPFLKHNYFFKISLFLMGLSIDEVSSFEKTYRNASVVKTNFLLNEHGDNTEFLLIKNKCVYKHPTWFFKLYNNMEIASGKKIKDFEIEVNDLIARFGKGNLEEAVGDPDFLSELRKLYKKHFKSTEFNNTSIVLLHYPRNRKYGIGFSQPCYSDSIFGCTLLTGDISFNKSGNMPVSINNDLLKSQLPLSVSQLPHHGSYKNLSPFLALINVSSSVFIMSYGVKNPWPLSFPDFKSISTIGKLHNSLVFVNEYNGFIYNTI